MKWRFVLWCRDESLDCSKLNLLIFPDQHFRRHWPKHLMLVIRLSLSTLRRSFFFEIGFWCQRKRKSWLSEWLQKAFNPNLEIVFVRVRRLFVFRRNFKICESRGHRETVTLGFFSLRRVKLAIAQHTCVSLRRPSGCFSLSSRLVALNKFCREQSS